MAFQPVSRDAEVDITCHAEALRVDDFIRAGIVKDGLGMDTSLVGEGAEAGDAIVEGNVDLDGFCHEVLNILELLKLVLGLDLIPVSSNHASH